MRPRGHASRRPGRGGRRRAVTRRWLPRCAPRRSRYRRYPSRARSKTLERGELAIAAASHLRHARARRGRADVVRATGGSEEELDCGLQDSRPPEPVFPHCSGKHAGMIAVCRGHGWPGRGLPPAEPSAPAARCSEEVAAAAERRRRTRSRPAGRLRGRRFGFRSSGRPRLLALEGLEAATDRRRHAGAPC